MNKLFSQPGLSPYLHHIMIEEASRQTHHLDAKKIDSLLGLKFSGTVHDILPDVLLDPIKELADRPGKKIRGRLVELGYQLGEKGEMDTHEVKRELSGLSQCVEYVHAGSLVVDDIQDGSKMRRGKPTLHLKYGLPVALNAGNWLYFWPYQMIQQMRLPIEKEVALYRITNQVMFQAHVGQALDVGVPIHRIPKNKVKDICLATLELKSGALFSLALRYGAILGGASEKRLAILEEFGHGFGMALQMFDDIGNVLGRKDPTKRWEDLMLKRPTWIWAHAADSTSDKSYDQLVNAVYQLPQDRLLNRWLEQNEFLEKASHRANHHLNQCFHQLEKQLDNPKLYRYVVDKLKSIGREITKAYE